MSSVEHQSGSALRFRMLAGALARRGHEVHLVEPVPPGTDAETPPNVRRHPCPRLPGRPELQVPLWAGHAVAAVRRVRPDVCWTLKALPNAWAAAVQARRLGARVAVDLDDLDWGYYPPGPARAVVRRFLERAAVRADDVTVHTEPLRALAAELRGAGSAPVLVDQPVDVARFAAAQRDGPAAVALRARLGLGEGPVLLYAGYLGPASDLGPLLPALARVPATFPSARLLVVGDGRVRSSLERTAHRQLPSGFACFVGTVAHAEVPRYYALADVALNYLEATEANRYRASIKLREALAARVPVVTSRTPDAERFEAWARLAVRPGVEAFVDEVLAELAAPDRGRADAGREWLAANGTADVAVRQIAERWEGSGA